MACLIYKVKLKSEYNGIKAGEVAVISGAEYSHLAVRRLIKEIIAIEKKEIETPPENKMMDKVKTKRKARRK